MSIVNEAQDHFISSSEVMPTSDVTDRTIESTPHFSKTSNDASNHLSDRDVLQGAISGGEFTTLHTDNYDEGSIQNNHSRDSVAASDPPTMDRDTEHHSDRGGQPRETSRSSLRESEPRVAPVREKDAIHSRGLFAPRRLVMLGFAGMFIILIVSLEILNYLSHRYTGIATVEQKAHYLWTYGPTLTITIIAICWSRVEFQVKQATAWSEIRREENATEKSLLLNYTTAPIHEVLYRSFRMSHYSVTLAVFGTLLLQLATLVSTGFLRLEYRDVTQQKTLSVLDSFDFLKNNGTYESTVGLRVWAIQRFSALYPTGTSSEFAAQSLASVQEMGNATLSADLEVFTARFNCQPFQWQYSATQNPNNTHPHSFNPWVDLTSLDCTVRNYCPWDSSPTGIQVTFIGDYHSGEVYTRRCSESSDLETLRILIHESAIHSNLRPPISNNVSSMAGAICTPTYSLDRRTVTSIQESTYDINMVEVSSGIKESLDLGATSADITTSIVESLKYSFGSDDTQHLFFQLLSAARPEISPTEFNDSTIIADASQLILPIVAHQWAKSGKTNTANFTVEGRVSQTKERLCIQILSLRLLEAFLSTMALISLVLGARHHLTRYTWPASIWSHALALAYTPAIERILNGTDTLSEKALKVALTRRSLSLSHSNHSSPSSTPSFFTSIEPLESLHTWKPFAKSWWFESVTMMAPVIVVAVLESVYQYSLKHQGIADVFLEGYTKYAWTFTPTLILSLIAFGFTMLDFSSRLMCPYQDLQKNNTTVKALLFETLGQPTIITIFQSLKARRYPLFAILLASALGPMLAIVASGLFVTKAISFEQGVPIRLGDWFDFFEDEGYVGIGDVPWKYGGDLRGVTSSDLIAFGNISYPQWTYDQLAFPTIHIDDSATNEFSTATSTLYLATRLPAVQMQPNCTLKAIRDYNQTDDVAIFTVETPGFYNASFCNWGSCISFGYSWLKGNSGDGFVAMTGLYNGHEDTFFEWYMVGKKMGRVIRDAVLVECTPYMEALYADVRLTYPSYRFHTAPTPIPNSTVFFARNYNAFYSAFRGVFPAPMNFVLHNDSIPPEADPGRIDPFFQALIWGPDGIPISELSELSKINTTLIPGIERLRARQLAQLLSGAYRSANATKGFVQHDYEDGETPPDLHDFLANLTGTLVDDSTHLRLVQTGASTRVLEALLLFMAACAVVSIVLSRRETGCSGSKVLYQDPGSIATKMSLFAGSRFVERLRNEVVCGEAETGDGGAGGKSWREMEQQVVEIFKECTFSLGWWDGDGQGFTPGRRFGIDIGVAEKMNEG